MHPGCCFVCQVGTRQEGYVNLDVYYDYEGQMYICVLCLKEVASLAGFLLPEESEFLQQRSEAVAEELASVKEQLDHANERLSHYDGVFRSVALSVAPDDSLPGENVTSVLNASGGAVSHVVKRAGSGKSKSKESVTQSGSNDTARPTGSDSGLSL